MLHPVASFRRNPPVCHGPLCIDRPSSRRWRRPDLASLHLTGAVFDKTSILFHIQGDSDTPETCSGILISDFRTRYSRRFGVTRNRYQISFRSTKPQWSAFMSCSCYFNISYMKLHVIKTIIIVLITGTSYSRMRAACLLFKRPHNFPFWPFIQSLLPFGRPSHPVSSV